MSNRLTKIALALGIVLMAGMPATAHLISVEFGIEVVDVYDNINEISNLGIDIQAGDTIYGYYTYDSDAAILANYGSSAIYGSAGLTSSLTLNINGYILEAQGVQMGIFNDYGTIGDQYTLSQLGKFDASTSIDMRLMLRDTSGEAFSSLSLPGYLPDLEAFGSQKNFTLDFWGDRMAGFSSILGTPTYFALGGVFGFAENFEVDFGMNSLPVPEPASLVSLGSCGLGLLMMRMRRRTTN